MKRKLIKIQLLCLLPPLKLVLFFISYQVTDPSLGYLVNRSCVRIHVEWIQSCLLFQSTYHHYDDVTRVQTYQMR